MSRPRSIRLALVAVLAVIVGIMVTAAVTARPAPLYGRCHESRCSCPAFQGTSYTCTRGGCRHHYDRHY